MVLGGLQNISPAWVFTCSFNIKQTLSTSCLVCLKFIFNILFYFTYYVFLIWWWCQLCANNRGQNFVGLGLSMEFVSCYISGNRILSFLMDFWKIFEPMILVNNSIAHLQSQYLQLHLLAEVLLFYWFSWVNVWIVTSELAWIFCATAQSVFYSQCSVKVSVNLLVGLEDSYHGWYVHVFIQSVHFPHSFYLLFIIVPLFTAT